MRNTNTWQILRLVNKKKINIVLFLPLFAFITFIIIIKFKKIIEIKAMLSWLYLKLNYEFILNYELIIRKNQKSNPIQILNWWK